MLFSSCARRTSSSLTPRVCMASLAVWWTWFCAWTRAWVKKQTPAQDTTWAVYHVYTFDAATDADSCSGRFVELPPKDWNPETWEADAREHTGWDAVKQEVRYTVRSRKYRMVLRPGDAVKFPPYDTPRPACRFPKGVLCARLVGDEDIECDVTGHVQKYQGPHSDFHAGLGLRVTVHDMFPFEDHDYVAERFHTLRVTDALARVTDYRYADNPVVSC